MERIGDSEQTRLFRVGQSLKVSSKGNDWLLFENDGLEEIFNEADDPNLQLLLLLFVLCCLWADNSGVFERDLDFDSMHVEQDIGVRFSTKFRFGLAADKLLDFSFTGI